MDSDVLASISAMNGWIDSMQSEELRSLGTLSYVTFRIPWNRNLMKLVEYLTYPFFCSSLWLCSPIDAHVSVVFQLNLISTVNHFIPPPPFHL